MAETKDEREARLKHQREAQARSDQERAAQRPGERMASSEQSAAERDREYDQADEQARVQRELEHGNDPDALPTQQTFYSDVHLPKPPRVAAKDVAPVGDDGGYNEARERQREYLARRSRAVSVHHQLGEQARAEGHYPGEILPLHQDKGMDAMLGKPGEWSASAKSLEERGVDPDTDFLIVRPVGKASRYQPGDPAV